MVVWLLTFNNPNTFMFAVEGPCISEIDETEYIFPLEIPQAAVY
jgi:hypothetical protein